MKLEKAFTIDGNVVVKEFQKDDISIYSRGDSDIEIVLYFVNNKTDEIMFMQAVAADMHQGTGYISEIIFKEVD